MNDSEELLSPDAKQIRERLNSLETRLSRLEAAFGTLSEARPASATDEGSDTESVEFSLGISPESESQIESRIGEYGLAWLGNIVLLFGIIFLTQYIMRLGHPLASGITGYILVTGLLVTSYLVRNSYSYMASVFTLFSQFLLFFITIRLHFFTDLPLLKTGWPVILLLLVLSGVQVVLALRKSSQLYAGMAIFFTLSAAVLSDSAHVLLSLTVVAAAGSMLLLHRKGWYKPVLFSVFLVYLVMLLWFLNNPVMGHPLQGITSHHNSYFYIAACAVLFSLVPLVPQNGRFPGHFVFTSIFLNGAGFSLLIGILVFLFFPKNYMGIFASIAFYCIGYAVILRKYSPRSYPPALFVLYGFVALSVTIYGFYGLPRSYFLLSVQSLLVLSVALWFRSKIIVVMNFFLFLFLLFSYAMTSRALVAINFSFPVIAFISARIINWQKERLKIKTDLIRNTYLVTLFFTMLYACYSTFPGQYVTLSWAVVAILYFIISLVIRNVKYRYLALANVLATAIYLFAVDLARVEILFRILAFLFLAIISIVISAFYVRKLRKKQREEDPS